MAQPTQAELIAIRASLERIARLSDGLIRIGPWGLGLDGILSWIPGLGELYSICAATFILAQGVRAQVPLATLLVAATLMGGRTVISALPFAGPLVADMFTLHRMSVRLIVRAIDKGQERCAGATPAAIEAA
jgi:hypothetical protein